ncbi:MULTISPECIES: ApeA N-terminal domain 1-containing protein [Bacillus]|uniref:ApeA N-terminal domain 1-containing protein n=1 Tax=Bacillus TaxID=1386 RepID=UPI00067FC4B6|nr:MULTISPECIES: HEPN domain-containing protein [Bacillus subtilis group]ARC58768.1 hypothetical protein BaDB11_00099 [Bacillus licheniformis]KND06177.1 hypothetical protein ACJ43_17555 [Bacillus paralicheniformis]MDE1403307.1 hypothetical protein [Bacillus licheniformis]MDE1425485.1 hypothetical protein [Bacillus licheniformis]MDK7626032.1 hypothetical protein [Bacillus licheniformis]
MVKTLKCESLDTFEVMGLWWTDEYPEKLTGTLKYSPRNITLELIGVIGDDDFFGSENKIPETIYGLSVKGEKFKVDVLGRVKVETNIPGIPTEIYRIKSFIAGNYIEEFPQHFDYAELLTDELTRWIGKRGFKESDEREKKSVEYYTPTVYKYNIPCIDASISEIHTLNTKRNYKYSDQVSLSHTSSFRIRPITEKDLNWFLDKIQSIVQFLNLILHQPLSNINIKLIKSGESFPYTFKYFTIPDNTSIGSSNLKKRFFFKYNEIQGQFENILNKWFEKKESLNTIISLYLSSFKDEYIESKFIKAVQALEIFHRRFREDTQINEQVYTENVDKIREFIEVNIENVEAKKLFLDKFKHGNEYNLGKRLRSLLKELLEETNRYIIGNSRNKTRFIQQVVETRNYLTHYDQSQKMQILHDPHEKYYASFRLTLILAIIILKELGIDEKRILTNLQDPHSEFEFILNSAKKFLNKETKV